MAMGSTQLTPSNRLTLVLSSAFLLRLLLHTQTSLPDLLTSRLEISTPITSFKRCNPAYIAILMIVKEGLFLYEHGVPPYNGGVCHQVLLPGVKVDTIGAIIVSILFCFGKSRSFPRTGDFSRLFIDGY